MDIYNFTFYEYIRYYHFQNIYEINSLNCNSNIEYSLNTKHLFSKHKAENGIKHLIDVT